MAEGQFGGLLRREGMPTKVARLEASEAAPAPKDGSPSKARNEAPDLDEDS